MRRLDRATSQINPYLLAIAIGLAVLYVTCLFALIVRLPVTHANVCVEASAPPTATSEAKSR